MGNKIIGLLKALVVGMFITAIMLVVIAVCVFKLGWDEKMMGISVIAVYAVANFVGGFLVAFREKKRRLICGVVYGLSYFAVLAVVSLALGTGQFHISGMLKCVVTSVVAGGIGGIVVK